MARLTLFELESVSPFVEAFLRNELEKTASLIEELLTGTAPAPAVPSLVAIGVMGALYQLAKEWVRSAYRLHVEDVVEALVSIGKGIRLAP
jgi:hypothetical protein